MPLDSLSDPVEAIEEILATPGIVGVDFETTVERTYLREGCTFQAAHIDGREAVVHYYRDSATETRIAAAVSASPATLVAHMAIFEMEMFLKMGARPKNLVCTYVASRVLRGRVDSDKNALRFDLDTVVGREIGMSLNKDTRVRNWREPLDPEAREYALDDVRAVRDLWVVYEEEFRASNRQWNAFSVINDAIPAIASCNLTGLEFDRDGHAALCVKLGDEIDLALFELDLMCDSEIENHNSPKQVSAWLAEQISFEEGCSPKRAGMLFKQITGEDWPLTSTGFSLDKAIVEKLLDTVAAGWPQVAKYLTARVAFKKAATLLSSFGPGLAEKVDPDGNIRGSLVPHGARTSRQSCRDPNLQNQPAEDEFRAMYKARKGRKIVVADYSQIELRVGAIICRDLFMQQVFAEGRDIHSATTEQVHGIVYDPSIKQHVKWRKGDKPVTFSALYGAQAPTISLNAKLPLEEARDLLNSWLGVYKGVKHYRETQPEEAMKLGYVELVSGQRITVLPTSRPAQLINAPVQGSAATVMYRALTRVHRALEISGLDARLALNVHDEILIDASEEDAMEAARILQEEMTLAMADFFPEARDMGLDRVADASIVDNWAQKDDDQFKYTTLLEAA